MNRLFLLMVAGSLGLLAGCSRDSGAPATPSNSKQENRDKQVEQLATKDVEVKVVSETKVAERKKTPQPEPKLPTIGTEENKKEIEVGPKKERLKIGFVASDSSPYWMDVLAGARRGAKEADVDLHFELPTRGDAEDQKIFLDGMTKRGVNGLAVKLSEPSKPADLKAIAEKIPVVVLFDDALTGSRLASLQVDAYGEGKAAGKLVKEAMPEGGPIALFAGIADMPFTRQHIAGLCDELAGEKEAKGPKFGKFTLVGDGPIADGGNPQRAAELARDFLDRHRDKTDMMLVGVWPYNGPALLDVLRSRNMVGKHKVVAVSDEVNAEAIRKGELAGVVITDLFDMGHRAVALLAAAAKGGKKTEETSVPIAFSAVNKFNLDDYERKVKKHREDK